MRGEGAIALAWSEKDRPMNRPRNKPNAFTLMEIMVAVVVLALLVGMASTVLTQTQRLVSISEAGIRQNAAASSLSQALRQSLRMASKNGPLCLTEVGSPARPRLVLTTAGPSASVRTNDRGMGSFVILGLVNNQADAATGLLWMPGYVLKRSVAGNHDDVWDIDFTTLQGYGRKTVNDLIINNAFCTGAISLRVPPDTIGDINLLWQVGAPYVTNLSIMWTDGTADADGNTNWYGRDSLGNLNAKDLGWTGRSADTIDNAANWPNPEYDGGGGAYRVLWTVHNQNYWPRAIKVRFTLRDPAMPKDFKSLDYEIIGTIGQ